MEANDPDLQYCADLVRGADPDRFAAAMLAPPIVRARLIALYAFNDEIARTRESVSEPMLGEIRLQWWRDVIEECVSGTPRRHMVVRPLNVAIRDARLPGEVLLEAIEARSRDLDDLPPADEVELARYVDGTGGTIGALAVQCAMGMQLSSRVAMAARAAGRAWAWIGLARGLHQHRKVGRRTVPATVLGKSPGLDREIELARAGSETRAWVEALVAKAEDELAQARSGLGDFPREAVVALAPATLARRYAALLRRASFDPFRADVARLSPFDRAIRLTLFSLPPRRL